MFKHILVPTDGSELSKKAIDGAIDLARTVGARVTAYACLPQYPYSPYADVVIEPPSDFQARSGLVPDGFANVAVLERLRGQ